MALLLLCHKYVITAWVKLSHFFTYAIAKHFGSVGQSQLFIATSPKTIFLESKRLDRIIIREAKMEPISQLVEFMTTASLDEFEVQLDLSNRTTL